MLFGLQRYKKLRKVVRLRFRYFFRRVYDISEYKRFNNLNE